MEMIVALVLFAGTVISWFVLPSGEAKPAKSGVKAPASSVRA
jgi:hypothetical protein